MVQIDLCALDKQLDQTIDKRLRITGCTIQRNGTHGVLAENFGQTAGQHRLRADFHKHPRAIGDHRLSHCDKVDRADQMIAHRAALIIDRRCMPSPKRVAVDRNGGQYPVHFGKCRVELRAGRLHQGRMKRLTDRHQRSLQTGSLNRGHRQINRRLGPGNHGLARAVQIGHDDICDIGNRCLRRLGIGGNGCHRAGAGWVAILHHRTTTCFGKPDQIGSTEGTGGVKCDKLAIAMPRRHVRLHAKSSENVQHPGLDGTKRRLRHFSCGQFGHLRLAARNGERISRPDQPGQLASGPAKTRRGAKRGFRLLHTVEHTRIHQRGLPQHAGILRSLARKHISQFPAGQQSGRLRIVQPVRSTHRIRAEERLRLGNLRGKIVGRCCHEPKPEHPCTGLTKRLQSQGPQGRHLGLTNFGNPGRQIGATGRGKHKRRQVHARIGSRRRGQRAGVFFQRHVKIGAAKSERADPGPARISGRGDPRTRRLRQVQRRGFIFENRIRIVNQRMRRQHTIVQTQSHFDQTRQTGSRLGVANQGFDRPDGAVPGRSTRRAQRTADGFKFGLVTCHSAGAMRLEQFDRGRIVARLRIGPRHGALLSGRQRCRQAFGPTIRRRTDPLDHRVNPVAVAFGIGQPL